VWQGASPDPVGFLRFNRVGETGETQRALCTQGAGGSDGKLTGVFVGVILGEENVGHVLTGHSALILDEAGELPVGLSLVGHTIKVSGGF
jgi:hypothetical protein